MGIRRRSSRPLRSLTIPSLPWQVGRQNRQNLLHYPLRKKGYPPMNDLLKLALLLEEKAMPLSRENPRRAYLLALAKAARQMGIEPLSPDYEIEREIGSHAKRAQVWTQMATLLSDGSPQKASLQARAERAAIHSGLEQLRRSAVLASKAA